MACGPHLSVITAPLESRPSPSPFPFLYSRPSFCNRLIEVSHANLTKLYAIPRIQELSNRAVHHFPPPFSHDFFARPFLTIRANLSIFNRSEHNQNKKLKRGLGNPTNPRILVEQRGEKRSLFFFVWILWEYLRLCRPHYQALLLRLQRRPHECTFCSSEGLLHPPRRKVFSFELLLWQLLLQKVLHPYFNA